MAVIKCKMCGGDLNIEADSTVAECEYCGSRQTIPTADNEKKMTLFARANRLLRSCEFDKATGIYESIVGEFPEEAEAYWGLILSAYGIEYVDDPATGNKVPTCHRSSFDSVMDDPNFEMVMEYADVSARLLYRNEAKQIEELRKGIIEVSANEAPYDIFISYKEKAESGERTLDSVLAQDIYDILTDKGYRVFFSRISLEDKLGIEYEPYIFAALNSAKIMLVIGTDYEYFNAVWVRNEWSRFLKLMAKDKSKHLIPCYKGMDAYDMPKEFTKLTAQDLGKVGATQDLVRGIDKLLRKNEKASAEPQTVVQQVVSGNVAPLLKRVFMFLEDGEWQKADDFCEQVLNQDPENVQAYLGKLMAELKVRKREQFADLPAPFDSNNNYQKVLRFSDEQLASELNGYINEINKRNENKRKDAIYNSGLAEMSGDMAEKYEAAIKLFETVSGWKDADELTTACKNKIEEIKVKKEAKAEEKRIAAELAAKKLKKVISIAAPIAVAVIAFLIVLTKAIIPNAKYNNAVEKYGKDWADTVKNAAVGDTITFGAYEQDNDSSNGKEEINWTVLKKKDMSLLLISEYAIDCQQYNTTYTGVTWETCTLRKWMNKIFLKEAFSPEEQAIIQTTIVSADRNPKYSTKPGNATEDKVFLLSINEVNKYFTNDSARQCKPTDYAVANGAYVNGGNGNCWWWLRSPGGSQSSAAGVYFDGSVVYFGYFVSSGADCVRPALWINLDS